MQHTRDSERAKRIKFEAGIMRDEYRNCIIRVETDKEGIIKFIWLNPPPNYCQVSAQVQPVDSLTLRSSRVGC